MTQHAVTVSVHTARDGVVASAWETLHRGTPGAHPALSPAYADLIEQAFAPPGQPLWLVAHRADTPVGLLHLRREDRMVGPMRQRRVLGGLGWHGYVTDVLADADHEPEIAGALAAALLRGSLGSAVHCWRIPAGGPLASVPRVREQLEATVAAPEVVHTDAPRRLTGKPGSNQRRLMRQLAEHGVLALRTITDPDENERIASQFTRMHSALKAVQQQLQVFDLSPGGHERFPPAWRDYCAAGHGSALVLTLDGTPIAISLQLHGAGVSASWRVARDAALGRYSLGLAMMDEAIESSRVRGDTRYLLGPGDEEYKRLWAPNPEPCYRLRAVAPGLRTLPLRLYGRVSGRSIV